MGRTLRLSEVFELAVANTSDTTQTVTVLATPTTFWIETRPYSNVSQVELPLPTGHVLNISLAPGERLPLLGAGGRFSRRI